MNNDIDIDIFNQHGKWITERAKQLISDAKQPDGINDGNRSRWKELSGRINQFKRDFKKYSNEGENWKNDQ